MMAPRSPRETIDLYIQALDGKSLDEAVALMDPDVVVEWPQSGERFRGRETVRALFKSYPGLPRGAKTSVTGSEDQWVLTPSWTPLQTIGTGDDYTMEGFVTYPNGERWSWVAIVHFRAGLIDKLTEYFAAPFPPAEWRARWAEKMETSAGS